MTLDVKTALYVTSLMILYLICTDVPRTQASETRALLKEPFFVGNELVTPHTGTQKPRPLLPFYPSAQKRESPAMSFTSLSSLFEVISS